MTTQLQQLIDLGQSPWYDNIRRSYITSGWLQALMAGGIRGVTVNPTIFEKAILDSTDYDAAMQDLLASGAGPSEIYQSLLIEDIRAAADLFRPLYDQTGGGDGYVSIGEARSGDPPEAGAAPGELAPDLPAMGAVGARGNWR